MKLAGVVFCTDAETWFLPASVAVKVMRMPEVARMPGGPPELRGVALVDGNMIPIVDVDPQSAPSSSLADARNARETKPASSKAMLVALVPGEHEAVGLVGLDILATGHFDSDDGFSARWGTVIARAFDVSRAIANVREGRWAV